MKDLWVRHTCSCKFARNVKESSNQLHISSREGEETTKKKPHIQIVALEEKQQGKKKVE